MPNFLPRRNAEALHQNRGIFLVGRRYWEHISSNPVQKPAWGQIQRPRQNDDIREADVALPSFHAADVSAVKSAGFGKRLLRKTKA